VVCRRCNLRESAVRGREYTIYNSANPWALLFLLPGHKPGATGFAGLIRELNPRCADAIRPVGVPSTVEAFLAAMEGKHVHLPDLRAGLTKAGL
jgi:hypothetical protein